MATHMHWCDNNNARLAGAGYHLDGVRTILGAATNSTQLGNQGLGATQKHAHRYIVDTDGMIGPNGPFDNCSDHRLLYAHLHTTP